MNSRLPDEAVLGDYDEYGMPTGLAAQGQHRSSGLMGRLKKGSKLNSMSGGSMKYHHGNDDDDDDDEIGVDPGASIPGISMQELTGLSDRHRYPTSSRTMSMASNATHDTTPIIPMMGSGGPQAKNKGNVQYRQRMIDQRRQLLSNETGLPMPGAPGQGGQGRPKSNMTMNGRTGSGLDPFSGFSNRAMSMSSQRGSMTSQRAMSITKQQHMSQMGGPPAMGGGPAQDQLRQQLDRERQNAAQLRQAHQQLLAEYQYLMENQGSRNLEDDHNALSDAYASLEAKYHALVEDHDGLRDENNMLKVQVSSPRKNSLQATHEDLKQAHEDLKRDLYHAQQKLRLNQAQLDSQPTIASDLELTQKHAELEQDHSQLQESHAQLQHEFEQLQLQPRTVVEAPAPNDTIKALQDANAELEGQVHFLSIELAESMRREMRLPTSTTEENLTSRVATLESKLAQERSRRLRAEQHLPPVETHDDLARSHAEATQLLDMRNQDYDILLQKLALAGDATAPTSRSVPGTPRADSSELQSQFMQLTEHAHFVEQENAKLQQMLDNVSDRGPLAERLKSTEDQRNVLQEALRTLRERKDYEIRLLVDRNRQLEARMDRSRIASSSSTSNGKIYNESRSSFSSEELDDGLEPPRIRVQPRPASPLHINFNMDVQHRTRSDQRTSPLPLALGN